MYKTRAALLAMGLLVAVPGPVGTAAAADGTVDIDDYGYTPGEVRIEPGEEVRWMNVGNQMHTVTSDDPDIEDFDSGRLDKGKDFAHTFSEARTYRYHCEVHSSMKGVVQVGPRPAATTSSTTSSTTTSSTTTTTRPDPTTTTTGPPPTTTTAPPSTTTTVTTSRTPAAAQAPAPPPSTAPTTATTGPAVTTTTAPAVESTTTTVGETTTTTAPAATEPATPLGPPVPEPPPPQEEDGEGDLAGQSASVPRSSRPDGGVNASVVLLVAALLGAGAFGAWTLWKLRPGNA
ncbi:MAG: plastocyanin/azurin family copper-binding protein [Actinomycetota bacterium]|nr:plastocyanin/azurin family copper-binding protein [Actinomycetota bacterium]